MPSVQQLRDGFAKLYAHLKTLGSPVVFAHNDLLLGNVIYTESCERVSFIDYEYADHNYQAFDIGNHFTEFAGMVYHGIYVFFRHYYSIFIANICITQASTKSITRDIRAKNSSTHGCERIWKRSPVRTQLATRKSIGCTHRSTRSHWRRTISGRSGHSFRPNTRPLRLILLRKCLATKIKIFNVK